MIYEIYHSIAVKSVGASIECASGEPKIAF